MDIFNVILAELFLRKKEDDIRISLQELSQHTYNEDEIIAELQTMMADVTRSRKTVPLVVELQELSQLNSEAQQRGVSLLPALAKDTHGLQDDGEGAGLHAGGMVEVSESVSITVAHTVRHTGNRTARPQAQGRAGVARVRSGDGVPLTGSRGNGVPPSGGSKDRPAQSSVSELRRPIEERENGKKPRNFVFSPQYVSSDNRSTSYPSALYTSNIPLPNSRSTATEDLRVA